MVDNKEKVIQILEGQLPDYFKPIREFQEILKAHGYAVGKVNEHAMRLRNNYYIATCDENTIAYYERLFDIKYYVGDSLTFRRARVLQKFNTIVPFSLEFLQDKLTELYGKKGYTLDMDVKALILKIKITSDRYGAVDLLYDLLWDVVPAHIQIIANQQTSVFVPGRAFAGGQLSGGTRIQTIYYQTVTEIENATNTTSTVSGLFVQTVETGG